MAGPAVAKTRSRSMTRKGLEAKTENYIPDPVWLSGGPPNRSHLSVLFLSGFTFVPCRNAKPINPAIAQKASRGETSLA
jgi:hypothetical protein